MISLLLPTRGRPGELAASVAGLIELADRPDQVQVCYAIDPDDPGTADTVQALRRPLDHVLTATERHGYAGLHRYVNASARCATGEWFMVWNDDATLLTPGWDSLVREHDGRDVVLDPRTDHDNTMPLFPVIPARYVRALGHLSLSPHCDSWWDDISNWLGILRPVDVLISHTPSGGRDDRTALESRAGARSAEFFGPELTAARQHDAAVIRDMIRGAQA